MVPVPVSVVITGALEIFLADRVRVSSGSSRTESARVVTLTVFVSPLVPVKRTSGGVAAT